MQHEKFRFLRSFLVFLLGFLKAITTFALESPDNVDESKPILLQMRNRTDHGIFLSPNSKPGLTTKVDSEILFIHLRTSVERAHYQSFQMGDFYGFGPVKINQVSEYYKLNPTFSSDVLTGAKGITFAELNAFDTYRKNINVLQFQEGKPIDSIAALDLRAGRIGMNLHVDDGSNVIFYGLTATGLDVALQSVLTTLYDSQFMARMKLVEISAGSVQESPGLAIQPIGLNMIFKKKLGTLGEFTVGVDAGAWFSEHFTPQVKLDKRLALERIHGGEVGLYYEHGQRWSEGQNFQVHRVGITTPF
jgi:hypothetical protein